MGSRLHPGGRASQALTRLVIATYGPVCHLCLLPGSDTRDHIVPRVAGGPDTLANCRPAHRRCNSKRQDRPLTAELLAEFRREVMDVELDAAAFFENLPNSLDGPPPVLFPGHHENRQEAR